MKHRKSRVLAAAAVLALSVPARGQQPASSSPPSVTFQTEVNYVDVDTIVTDEQGHFVGGLTQDDFDVREDGKPQKIEMFSTVEIPVERSDRSRFMDRPIAPDVWTNRERFAGRVYVIVLDDQDISPMRSAQTRKTAREFVEKHLGANDVAAVIYTSGRADAAQEFTSDPQLLLASIDKFMGRRLRPATLDRIDEYYQRLAMQSGSSDSSQDSADTNTTQTDRTPATLDTNDFERSFRAIGVLDTLKSLSEFLSSVRGRRKAVIMFSEGIDYPMTDVFGTGSATDVLRATQDAITAAARANVNFFTVDPRGLVGMTAEFIEMAGTGMPEVLGSGAGGTVTTLNGPKDLLDEMRLSQDSLRTLAEETGGFAMVDSNNFTSAFDRIVQANSRYYVLGYYPPTHPRDGRFHKIEVRVKRPGLKVSARKGYASPRGKTPEERRRDEDARRARESKNGGGDNTSPPLREILNGPMQQGNLTFAAQAAAFRNTDKDASIAMAIEFDGPALKFEPTNGLFADSVELVFFAVNDQGKPQKATRSQLTLNLRPETYQRVQKAGLRANPRMTLAPGRYHVRVGARETVGGALGAVFYDLQVPDFAKDPLMMSGLLMTAPSTEQIPTAQPDPTLAKLLPGAPTSRREFLRSDTLSLLAEIYDNSKSQQPRQIDTAVRLISESGQDVFVARDSLANTGDAKKWEVYAYTRQIPFANVPAGRYLLRLEAQVRGNTNAKPALRETLVTIR